MPARILEFSIEPASIKPGQTVNLRWAVENPASTDIDPGIRPVKPKDVRQLLPAATTTYTLSVRGPIGLLTKSVTVTVAGTKPLEPVPVQTEAGPRKTPRMADGKPNLTGVYNSSSIVFASRQPGGMRDPIVAVLKPGAEKFKVVRAARITPGSPRTACRLGTNWAHSREVTFKDGKKLFFGPPAGTSGSGPCWRYLPRR